MNNMSHDDAIVDHVTITCVCTGTIIVRLHDKHGSNWETSVGKYKYLSLTPINKY